MEWISALDIGFCLLSICDFLTDKLMNIGDDKLRINSISLFMKVYILSRMHNRQYSVYLVCYVTALFW